MAGSSCLLVVLIFLCLFSVSFSDDKQALLDFISAVRHESRINWNSSSSHCSWTGVFCDSAGADRVRILRLPAVGLVGEIPAKTIGNLTELRVVSLHTNKLSGGIPQDFLNLKFLRSLYLQNNEFTGKFPSFLPGLTRLTRVDLSNNEFSGKLPFAINNLTELTGLFLQNNAFSGVIPSIEVTGMTGFNISNNKLNGSIPPTLQRFPESAFSGNLQLCGPPLAVSCTPFFPTPISPSGGGIIGRPVASHHGKLSRTAIIAIAVVAASVLLILLILILFLLISRRRKQGDAGTSKGQSRGVEIGGSSSMKDEYMGGGAQEAERNKLVFFNGIKGGGGGSGGGYNFDLDDLLRASAEVLGKGSVGTSYKAVLEDGTTVVVKRLKDVSVGKKEFEGVLESLGGAQHSNLVPLRAYYYSKDEKLLVLDYLATGSLSAMLHGSRGSGRTPLDWDSRMKIAVHAARGLAYLHEDAKVVHGNIKSSNILLRQDHGACVSDFGLQPLFSLASSTPSASRVAGYRAPEVMETRKVTFKSDIYSFGVLLLEVLTGKSPNQASLNDQGIDLPRWVQSVVREEWTAEVFDVDLMRYQNIEEEMVQLLQIAMACVATMPDQRPSIHEVLRMIEDINRVDTDDGRMRHSSDDKSKGSESHATPSEVRTPPSTATP